MKLADDTTFESVVKSGEYLFSINRLCLAAIRNRTGKRPGRSPGVEARRFCVVTCEQVGQVSKSPGLPESNCPVGSFHVD